MTHGIIVRIITLRIILIAGFTHIGAGIITHIIAHIIIVIIITIIIMADIMGIITIIAGIGIMHTITDIAIRYEVAWQV